MDRALHSRLQLAEPRKTGMDGLDDCRTVLLPTHLLCAPRLGLTTRHNELFDAPLLSCERRARSLATSFIVSGVGIVDS